MNEMVEKVARAIFESDVSHGIYGDTWGEESEHDKGWYREDARAVLKAMREPTEEMLKASAGTKVDCYLDSSAGVHPEQWQAMIDAALK